jgi:nicotinamidase-related amidase
MPDERSALLVMDVQEEIVARLDAAVLLERLGRATAVARANGVPVIYVKVAFRPGYPEVSRRNQSFSAISQSGGFLEDSSRVHPAVAPRPGDIEVIKKRVSAFSGSDLDVVLRAQEIGTMVLTGIATSGVVLSTLRAAADMDYRLIVLRDCCLDGDEEVHRVLMEKVFPRQAELLDVESWQRRLSAPD